MLRIRYLLPVLFFTLWLIACGRTATLPPPPATPTLDPQASLGKELFTRECASCHSLLEDTVLVGPSMKGIAQRAESRIPDEDAHAYILSSIIDPGGYVLEGYQDLMPANFGKRLTGEEIDALVAYMLTLE